MKVKLPASIALSLLAIVAHLSIFSSMSAFAGERCFRDSNGTLICCDENGTCAPR
jgi:hypothetical protein